LRITKNGACCGVLVDMVSSEVIVLVENWRTKVRLLIIFDVMEKLAHSS
jgi:hypothetical protein